jgi:hypothetical protein
LGTIETPLAMTLAGPVADGVAVGAKVLTGRLPMIAAASLGETVVVLANELVKLEFEFMFGLDDEELLLLLLLLLPLLLLLLLLLLLPLLLLPLLPLLRMRMEISSMLTSTKVIVGPATIALLCRSMTLPFKG